MIDDPLITIVELPSFLAEVGSTISPEDRDDLVVFLSRYPARGDEIPRTGGLRKLRWRTHNKGKRGGIRVIYFYYNDTAPLYLLSAYKKGSQDNLSSEDERVLSALAKVLKESLKLNSRGIR